MRRCTKKYQKDPSSFSIAPLCGQVALAQHRFVEDCNLIEQNLVSHSRSICVLLKICISQVQNSCGVLVCRGFACFRVSGLPVTHSDTLISPTETLISYTWPILARVSNSQVASDPSMVPVMKDAGFFLWHFRLQSPQTKAWNPEGWNADQAPCKRTRTLDSNCANSGNENMLLHHEHHNRGFFGALRSGQRSLDALVRAVSQEQRPLFPQILQY